MGAFLAALGAVLLFILRVIGILLLVVLILLMLLLLCPFCADLCWEHGVLTVKAGALGITFPVFQYPKPEPPPAPENPEPPRGFGKVKAKFAAWRAERKRKRQRRRPAKRPPPLPPRQTSPSSRAKRQRSRWRSLCTMLKGAGTLTKAVFGALRITKIQVRLGVRGEDSAAAARSYGKLQAWLYPVLGVLDRFLWLQFDELRILPDFGSGQPTVEDRVSCRVSAQALFIVLAAVRVLYEFWRKKYWTSSYNVVHYTCIRICRQRAFARIKPIKESCFMAEHPIQGLMNVTMEKIHQMVDSNTIIGKPIITEDGTTIPAGFQGELWLCLRRHRL